MAIRACRVCQSPFFEEPLLRYANMPKAAQNFPDAEGLAYEAGVDLEVYQCAGCGLVQLSNEPVPYYREVIRAAAVSEVIGTFKTKQFSEFIREFSLQGGKVLEVGCGRGEFLSLLSPGEVEPYGLEYSEDSVAACLKMGLRVSQGYPDETAGRLDSGPFDGFLLLMFLEHMPNPGAALRMIWDNLADNAVGLVEVPNFDMVLRNRLFSEFIGDHLLYFTEETLRTTLRLNGFDVLKSCEVREDYVISVVVRKRGRLAMCHFYDYQDKITAELRAYIRRFAPQRVAVWGAGHQALAIIALTGIADSLRYVVDSATFKQGKYTPASHLPVVAPEALLTDPVDAVIIIAASYSDEVAGIVRRRLGVNIPVAILRDFGLEMV